MRGFDIKLTGPSFGKFGPFAAATQDVGSRTGGRGMGADMRPPESGRGLQSLSTADKRWRRRKKIFCVDSCQLGTNQLLTLV